MKMVSPQKSTKLYLTLGAEKSMKSKFISSDSNEYNKYIYILKIENHPLSILSEILYLPETHHFSS